VIASLGLISNCASDADFALVGNHLPPDAMHFVLQVLLSGGVVTGTMAVLR
jgi:hypothetical protein